MKIGQEFSDKRYLGGGRSRGAGPPRDVSPGRHQGRHRDQEPSHCVNLSV